MKNYVKIMLLSLLTMVSLNAAQIVWSNGIINLETESGSGYTTVGYDGYITHIWVDSDSDSKYCYLLQEGVVLSIITPNDKGNHGPVESIKFYERIINIEKGASFRVVISDEQVPVGTQLSSSTYISKLFSVVDYLIKPRNVALTSYVRAGVILYPGFNLVSVPFVMGNNTVEEMLPEPPINTLLYLYDNEKGYSIYEYTEEEGWGTAANIQLPVGKGFFLRVAKSTGIVFAGHIANNAVNLTPGFNLVGPIMSGGGKITSDLNYVPTEGDVVYILNKNQEYSISLFEDGNWSPSEPELKGGSGVWIRTNDRKHWN